jgi:lipoyl synthase
MNNPAKNIDKVARIPIRPNPDRPLAKKPSWIRVPAPQGNGVTRIRKLLRSHDLHTVCEEASCPNLGECFSHGTATFMIMGDVCTRRCPFCDVAHGRPQPLNPEEPEKLALAIKDMGLRHVVITSVDRDDLKDGGSGHFAHCIAAIRKQHPNVVIEILVPDFRGREQRALDILQATPPDIFNHNMETVPSLYKKARPGADYAGSLKLLANFKQQNPQVPTKSGLMLGLGETLDEVVKTMQDLRDHHCELLTLGQYLQPSRYHMAVEEFITPATFDELKETGMKMGFSHVASAPLVRSSYHADEQAKNSR